MTVCREARLAELNTDKKRDCAPFAFEMAKGLRAKPGAVACIQIKLKIKGDSCTHADINSKDHCSAGVCAL